MTIWRCNPCNRLHLRVGPWGKHCSRCFAYLIPGMGVYHSAVWKKP